MDRINWPVNKCVLQPPAVTRRVAPKLERQHLAEVPVLPEGLHHWIDPLPFRSQVMVIDTGIRLADSLKMIGRTTAVRETERGQAFPVGELTNFGQAVDVMRFTVKQHGLAARSITARMVADEGRIELVFTICRNVVSLFDYV
jgi:hypothetical protein